MDKDPDVSNLNLYGFWKYDQFPYILGDQITRITSTGRIETVNYGKGSTFLPIVIVPLDTGIRVQKVLDSYYEEYRMDLEALKKKYDDKIYLSKIMSDLGV